MSRESETWRRVERLQKKGMRIGHDKSTISCASCGKAVERYGCMMAILNSWGKIPPVYTAECLKCARRGPRVKPRSNGGITYL